MSTATELRTQLRAKIAAMPLGMLLAAHDDLSAKVDRDESESLVNSMMAGEVAGHMRRMVAEFSTDSLIADLHKYMAMDYPTMKATDRAAYWAVTGELETRFPAASAAANEWLDTMTPEHKDAAESNAWDNYLLELIAAERVTA
jgi:hypothetical protein